MSLMTAIIDNAPVAIFTLDKKGRFTSVNPALAELSGLGDRAAEKLLGFNWLTNSFHDKIGTGETYQEGAQGRAVPAVGFSFHHVQGRS